MACGTAQLSQADHSRSLRRVRIVEGSHPGAPASAYCTRPGSHNSSRGQLCPHTSLSQALPVRQPPTHRGGPGPVWVCEGAALLFVTLQGNLSQTVVEESRILSRKHSGLLASKHTGPRSQTVALVGFSQGRSAALAHVEVNNTGSVPGRGGTGRCTEQAGGGSSA